MKDAIFEDVPLEEQRPIGRLHTIVDKDYYRLM